MDTSIPDIYTMPDNTYLQIAAVLAIVGMNRQQLFDVVEAGTFPKPREVNDSIPLWLVGDIKGWLMAQQDTNTESV